MRKFLSVIALCAILFSCTQSGDYSAYTANPILYAHTVKRLNDIVLENNFPPMIASRNYVYANIAAYECIAAGDSSYKSLVGQIKHFNDVPEAPAGNSIDFNFAAVLAFTKVGNAVTFPEGSMMGYYDDLLKNARKNGMPKEVREQSQAFADAIVKAVMDWARKDNYAETRSAPKYTVTTEEGKWVPTPPAYSSALEAHWMEIRTLVLDSAAQCKPARPPHYNVKDTTSAYFRSVMEVKRIGDSLTEEQKHIADFWDDNPGKLNVHGHVMFMTKKFSPGGHWMNIVGIAADKARCDFATTVYAYTKTAIALHEGFISCWDEKYRSNTVRPETVINKYIDPDWRPYIQTPPFPSYVSGHSVISAAAAEVMTEIFGDNFNYKDTSEIEFGIKHRSFTSFRQAALEASWSRLYGGIHFRHDLEEGNRQGIKVGELVVERLRMKKVTPTILTKTNN